MHALLPAWDPTAHAWHHIEFAIYAIVVVLIFYRPPRKASGAVDAIKGIFEAHWGDSIGLYLLHLGIGLVILAGVWPNMTQVGQVGFALVTASMAVLKLKAPAEPNGQSPAAPPAPALAAPPPQPAPAASPAPSAAPAGWAKQ